MQAVAHLLPYNGGVRLLCLCFVVGLLASGAAAQDRRGALERLMAQLADRNAEVRDTARRELMGMAPSELPMLRELAVAAKPLGLSQQQGLHEVVLYVRARGHILQARQTTSPFLGIRYPNPLDNDLAPAAPEQSPPGIPVISRVVGFAGYRYLEEGDILLAMGPPDHPDPLRRRVDLENVMRVLRAGDEVELHVQRGAAVVKLRFPLDAHPRVVEKETEINNLSLTAEATAMAYWEEQFAPLMGDGTV